MPERQSTPELKELRLRIADRVDRSLGKKRQAHEALDEERYEAAAEFHRESLALAREADDLRAAEAPLVRATAQKRVADLGHEEIAVRDAATRELLDLDAPTSVLREVARDLSPEAARRFDMIVRKLEERLHRRQWASGATASTEYGNPSWAASQATGAPNTPEAGDRSTAWASAGQDAGEEWLALTFDEAVEPVAIRVHETYNAGAISKVEAKDATGAWRLVWEGAAAACETPRWFEAPVSGAGWTTREIRITLDSGGVPGWNEIDAVELLGRDPRVGASR